MTYYKYLGYGMTNNNGVAKLDHDANGNSISHSYTGVGAGELDIIASLDNPINDNSLVSETFSLEDCKYLDTFSTDTSNNYFVGSGSLSVSNGMLYYTGGGTDLNNYFNIKSAVAPSVNLFKGNTATFKAEISNLPNGVTVRVRIFQTVGGSSTSTYTDYTTEGLCSHSASIDENATAIIFRMQFVGLGTNTVNIDNFRAY